MADSPVTALNAICPYYTMFPLAFPLEHLRTLSRGRWVLDPFCGRGTTLFAARLLGLPSVGIDVNPVAVAIARAKLVAPDPEDVVKLAAKLIASRRRPTVPSGAFWRLAFHANTLNALLRLREGLANRRGAAADALRGIVLGALHGQQMKTKDSYFSNQMQRTFAPKPAYALRFWRRHRLRPRDVDVMSVLKERTSRFYAQAAGELPPAKVYLRDARRIPSADLRYAAVVTSPPYFGMDSYIPDQWLRNWFLGGPSQPVYPRSNQLARGTEEQFVLALANVWRAVAEKCEPGATLAIRFGSIDSRRTKPEQLLRKSIVLADAGWRITHTASAGHPRDGYRQSLQMGADVASSSGSKEIDLVCHLRTRRRNKQHHS